MKEWLWWAVDLLASEYGWWKDKILNELYFDELYYLSQEIKKRKMIEYRMQLAIAHNPHVKDPKQLWESLNTEERLPVDDVLDEKSFDAFKNMMSKRGVLEVK